MLTCAASDLIFVNHVINTEPLTNDIEFRPLSMTKPDAIIFTVAAAVDNHASRIGKRCRATDGGWNGLAEKKYIGKWIQNSDAALRLNEKKKLKKNQQILQYSFNLRTLTVCHRLNSFHILSHLLGLLELSWHPQSTHSLTHHTQKRVIVQHENKLNEIVLHLLCHWLGYQLNSNSTNEIFASVWAIKYEATVVTFHSLFLIHSLRRFDCKPQTDITHRLNCGVSSGISKLHLNGKH